MANYHIYTDGSARFNPGPGGWGMVVMNEEDTKMIAQMRASHPIATNNQEELRAMICAFEYAEAHPNDYFIIFSDSTYVVKSINEWMRNWAANGWRNSKKQQVENIDLMKALYTYVSRPFFNAEVRHCKGHAGELGNEIADALAVGDRNKYEELAECWLDEYCAWDDNN